jgi:hypothetical protein
MPDRPQPQLDPSEAEARRAANLRAFRRNQVLGLILFGAAILAWWYFHANKSWIWTPGWWRP